MQGIMTIPKLTINGQELGVKASFWVMENATDEVSMSADWMKQLSAKIDFERETMTYHKPKKDLHPDNVTLQTNPNFTNEEENPSATNLNLKENTEDTEKENKIYKILIKSKNIIKPLRAVTITLTQEQGMKVSKVCTKINKANKYQRNTIREKKVKRQFRKELDTDKISKATYLPPLDAADITQPVTVNDMPGLLCKHKKGRKYVRIIIPNVSATLIRLHQTLHIKPREPPRFHTIKPEKNCDKPEQTVMEIEPKMENNIILTITGAGQVGRVHEDKLT